MSAREVLAKTWLIKKNKTSEASLTQLAAVLVELSWKRTWPTILLLSRHRKIRTSEPMTWSSEGWMRCWDKTPATRYVHEDVGAALTICPPFEASGVSRSRNSMLVRQPSELSSRDAIVPARQVIKTLESWIAFPGYKVRRSIAIDAVALVQTPATKSSKKLFEGLIRSCTARGDGERKEWHDANPYMGECAESPQMKARDQHSKLRVRWKDFHSALGTADLHRLARRSIKRLNIVSSWLFQLPRWCNLFSFKRIV